MYHTVFFATWFITTHDYVILVAGLRFVPFLTYVVLLGVIYLVWVLSGNSIPAYDQLRILPMYVAVSHCSYDKCTTAAKPMSKSRYSPR